MPTTLQKRALHDLAVDARHAFRGEDRKRATLAATERALEQLRALPGVIGLFVPVISLIVLPRMGESLLFLARLVGTTLWFFEPGGRMIRWSGGA
jgi:Flp pilus assembly protein TadB